jgi:hypothetical protein
LIISDKLENPSFFGENLPVTCCLYSTHDEQLSTRGGLGIFPLGLWE